MPSTQGWNETRRTLHLEDLGLPVSSECGSRTPPLTCALDLTRLNAYAGDGFLAEAVDAFANAARTRGWSIEEVLGVAQHALHGIAPPATALGSDAAAAKAAWRAYFDLYDATLSRVTKTFVTGGLFGAIVRS